MAAPTNRIPVRVGRGSRAALDSSLANIQEGELVYARDEDSLYVKDNGILVNVAVGQGVTDFVVSAEITWAIGISGGGYTFSGQGFYGSTPNPTLYVVRGQKYKFEHALGTDPFRIVTPGGGSYSTGIINNPVSEDTMRWEVSMEAPPKLAYVSDTDPAKTGIIYVLTDALQGDLEDLDNVSSTPALNGQALLYSTATNMWAPANLAAGGVTNLGGLTDVDTTQKAVGEVLTYDGSVWESKALPNDPSTAGRRTAININSSRTDQMLGTEFPLNDQAGWENQGFTVSTQNVPPESFYAEEFSFMDTFNPLQNSDSNSNEGTVYIDGSGRFFTALVDDNLGIPTVSSTIRLSVPEAVAFAAIPFLDGFDTTLDIFGFKSNVSRGGKLWQVFRAEYSQAPDKQLAVEWWFSPQGDIKMMYGRQVNGFVIEVNNNKNGFVFGARSEDDTIGDVNQRLPALQASCDYVIELWASGNGYSLAELSDVYGDDVKPPLPGQALTWVQDKWEPGSNVELGSVASTSSGYVGQFRIDAQYFYVAVGPNSWKRIPLESFS